MTQFILHVFPEVSETWGNMFTMSHDLIIKSEKCTGSHVEQYFYVFKSLL